MDNLALITWSHTSYSDIWPLYFGQLEKHFNSMPKSYVFLESESSKLPDKHIALINREADPYYKRFLDCLDNIEEEYVLYLQEDHIFYKDIDTQRVKDFIDILNKNSQFSFVRLIKSGALGGIKWGNDLYTVPRSSTYLFSLQSAIWKKEDLRKLYMYFRPHQFRDAESYGSLAMSAINQKGLYYYNNEPQRGSLHFDSDVFPYVATAVNKGKWNLKQYRSELMPLLDQYGIDWKVRGEY